MATVVDTDDVLFMQFSDKLLTKDNRFRKYYTAAYKSIKGYHCPEHYMEVPYWIAVISGILKRSGRKLELHIVTDMDASVTFLAERRPGIVMMSVLDANIMHAKYIIERERGNIKYVLGGYTEKSAFQSYNSVKYLSDVSALSAIFSDARQDAPPDYSLFHGLQCIPRLTMSTGCLFRCRFCTDIPLFLTEMPDHYVEQSVLSLEPLRFSFIYLDDKSFGQAPGWRRIGKIAKLVKRYNPDFEGFAIQTPPSIAVRENFLEEAYGLGVRLVELGIELVDDKFLQKMNKPFRVKHLEPLMKRARQIGVHIVPNLIIGYPGSDYSATIEFIRENLDIIPWVNVNYFSVHNNNVRGEIEIVARATSDRDQNSAVKSWTDDETYSAGEKAIDAVYHLTTDRVYRQLVLDELPEGAI